MALLIQTARPIKHESTKRKEEETQTEKTTIKSNATRAWIYRHYYHH